MIKQIANRSLCLVIISIYNKYPINMNYSLDEKEAIRASDSCVVGMPKL